MNLRIDMHEVEQLAAELAAEPARVTRLESRTLTRIAAETRDDAKQRAPVDTGELRSSIGIQGGDGYRIIRATARHAYFVEFGTSDTPPQPYLWPAADRAGVSMSEAFAELGNPFQGRTPG